MLDQPSVIVTLVTAVDNNGPDVSFPGASSPRVDNLWRMHEPSDRGERLPRALRGPGSCVASPPVSTPRQPPLPSPDRRRVPAPLVVAASLVAVEAVCLVLFGLAELRSLTASKLAMGVTTSLFFAVYGVGLGAFAWLLQRRRSWVRAPVVLAQLIQLGVAWSFRSGDTAFVSVLLTVVAVIVLVGIFHPASLAALAETDEGQGP